MTGVLDGVIKSIMTRQESTWPTVHMLHIMRLHAMRPATNELGRMYDRLGKGVRKLLQLLRALWSTSCGTL